MAAERWCDRAPHCSHSNIIFEKLLWLQCGVFFSRSRKRTTSQASRIVVEASFSPGKADDDNDDGGALDDVLRLLDAAEPHAPPGSPLRERMLALRACAANRVPGRAALAAADLRDVLEHGAEHARDARRRGAALLELSRALQDDAAAPSLWSLYNVWPQRTRRARETAARDPALGRARYAREESCSSHGAALQPSPGHIRHRSTLFGTRKCLRAPHFALRWRDLEDTLWRPFSASEISRPA